jgi:hypothetical protein
MSQVQVSRWIMSDRLDRDRPASIQLTTSNNENKANRLHPFYGIRTYGGRLIKAQRSITIKATDRPSSYDLPCGSSIVLIEIVIEMVKQLTT